MKGQATDQEKIFASYTSDKGLLFRKYLQITLLTKDFYSEYTKNSQNSAVRKQTTQLKMIKITEQTLHQRQYTDVKLAYEKKHVINHLENTN